MQYPPFCKSPLCGATASVRPTGSWRPGRDATLQLECGMAGKPGGLCQVLSDLTTQGQNCTGIQANVSDRFFYFTRLSQGLNSQPSRTHWLVKKSLLPYQLSHTPILSILLGFPTYLENLENLEFFHFLFQAWKMHGICSKSYKNF